MDTTARTQRRDRVAAERRFLDELCFWRALYGARGPQDRTAVASVSSLVAEASRQLASNASGVVAA